MQPQVNIVTKKKAEDKQDSFWYYDKQIASVELNGRTISVEARGSISISFTPSGKAYGDKDAVKAATRRKYRDTDLQHLEDNGGCWLMNNWFAIVELNENGEPAQDEEVEYTYDAAIEVAKELLLQK